MPPSIAAAGTSFSGSSTCSSVFLRPSGEQHDARHHREVQVGERVARDLVALACPARRSTAGARRPAPRRRSTATTARPATPMPSTAADDDARVDARPRRRRRSPRSTRPSAMITISPWRSAKWPGTSFQPLEPKKYGPPMSSSERERPQRALQQPVGERGATSSPTPIAGADRQPDAPSGAAPGSSRLAITNSQICADRARTPYAHGEQQRRRRRTPPGRTAPRRATPPSRRTSPAAPSLLGVDHAGQPRVADPRPPQHPEHEQSLGEARPRRARAPSAPCTG